MQELQALLTKHVGPLDFVRVGQPPKAAVFYRVDEFVETRAGVGVELFGRAGRNKSSPIARHPDTHKEYTWPGPCNPVDNKITDMPRASARALDNYHRRALELLVRELPSPVRATSAQSSLGLATNIGSVMSEVLR